MKGSHETYAFKSIQMSGQVFQLREIHVDSAIKIFDV